MSTFGERTTAADTEAAGFRAVILALVVTVAFSFLFFYMMRWAASSSERRQRSRHQRANIGDGYTATVKHKKSISTVRQPKKKNSNNKNVLIKSPFTSMTNTIMNNDSSIQNTDTNSKNVIKKKNNNDDYIINRDNSDHRKNTSSNLNDISTANFPIVNGIKDNQMSNNSGGEGNRQTRRQRQKQQSSNNNDMVYKKNDFTVAHSMLLPENKYDDNEEDQGEWITMINGNAIAVGNSCSELNKQKQQNFQQHETQPQQQIQRRRDKPQQQPSKPQQQPPPKPQQQPPPKPQQQPPPKLQQQQLPKLQQQQQSPKQQQQHQPPKPQQQQSPKSQQQQQPPKSQEQQRINMLPTLAEVTLGKVKATVIDKQSPQKNNCQENNGKQSQTHNEQLPIKRFVNETTIEHDKELKKENPRIKQNVPLRTIDRETSTINQLRAQHDAAIKALHMERDSQMLTLRNEIEVLRRTLSKNDALVNFKTSDLMSVQAHEYAIRDLLAENVKLREEIDKLRLVHETTVKNLRAEHQTEITGMRTECDNFQSATIKKLQTEHDTSIQKTCENIRAKHEIAIKALRDENTHLSASHEITTKTLRDEYDAAMKQSHIEHEATVKQLRIEHENAIKKLRSDHETAIADVTQRCIDETTKRLHDQHQIEVERLNQQFIEDKLQRDQALTTKITKADDDSNEANAEHLELEMQNQKLLNTLSYYKQIIADTEQMLSRLQGHIDREESRWTLHAENLQQQLDETRRQLDDQIHKKKNHEDNSED